MAFGLQKLLENTVWVSIFFFFLNEVKNPKWFYHTKILK